MNEIFIKIKNRRKLKIIKYNKKTTRRLNITIEDFKVYENLKAFNKKFNNIIDDIDIEEINLNEKDIENNDLQLLCQIKFKSLKEFI